MNIIEVIEDSSCLSNSDFEFVKSNSIKLQDAWGKRQVFRTRTEMEVSVLNDVKHPTRASKYWQAIREQAHFYEILIGDSFAYKRNTIEIEKKKLEIGKENDELERQLFEIDLDELYFRRAGMEQVASDRIRELREWDDILSQLDDGSFDNENVNTHQLESMSQSTTNKLNLMGNNAPPADRANIVGLHSTVKRAIDDGVTEIKGVSDEKVHRISNK